MKRLISMSVLAFMAAATNLHAESINVLVEGGGESLQKDIAAKFTKDTGIDVKFTESFDEQWQAQCGTWR